MQAVRRKNSLPLRLTVSAVGDPPSVASLRVLERVSGSEHRFDLTASPAEMTFPPSSELLILDLRFSFGGQPGMAYRSQVDLSQLDKTIADFTLEGTLSNESTAHVRHVFHVLPEKIPGHERAPGWWGRPGRAKGDRGKDNRGKFPVFYGTNRRRVDAGDLSKGYSADRSSGIEYGTCTVYVPQSHKIGSTGSSWWRRLLTGTDDRLRLLKIRSTTADEHWRQMRERLHTISESDQDAVLFIHGYNVSFEGAALRAAQIGFDLSIMGPMAFFSWPSQGRLNRYLADTATIEASEGAITDYLSDFATRSGAKRVHVIAHSMGNRGILRAVNRIAEKAQKGAGVLFSQIILAAPDVDADVFRSLCSAYSQVALRTTLYISQRDRAIEASYWFHEFPRVGFAPPVFIAPGIDTVNVTNADLTLLGHGYVAEARDVLTDMHALIRHNSPPEDRFSLREAHTDAGERFWLIGA